RKLGDEVMFVTQHVRNVDTQLRRVAQDFSYVKNLKKVKLPLFFGIIKAPSIFVCSTYLEERTGAVGQEAMQVRSFRLDASGVASCYETAAGVGVMGAAADTNDKAKGLPFWTLPLVVVALLGIIFGGWGCATHIAN